MKTVLITGASRGIGRATALEFANRGYNVAINYKSSKDKAEELCREIKERGGSAQAFCADVSKNEEVKEMVKKVNETFGSIDVLVNNAGVAPKQGLFTDFSDETTESVFDVNVFGTMNCTKAVVPQMVSKKSGKIINVSSIWGVCGGSCEVLYSASKSAVIGFTKALAKELAPSGVNVNCVAPGFVDTDMNSHLTEEEKNEFCQEIPLGRAGTPDEIAKIIYFLASDGAAYITGQTIVADGGFI